MKKSNIISLVIIIMAVLTSALYWSGKFSFLSERIEVRDFWGGLQNIAPDDPNASEVVLTVPGSFMSSEHPELAATPQYDMKIIVNGNTRIERVLIKLPPLEELVKMGWYNTDDLEREISNGSIRTLVQDFKDRDSLGKINIISEASRNIYGQKGFTASYLKYEIIPEIK